jgi:DNA-binding PadR family transcriptional regulator
MTAQRLTDFEQILLGLLARAPQSGYELKKFFTDTPAVVYRPSSGALYPALRRLERRGLLSSTELPSAGRRTRRAYRATEAGLVLHHRWLREPVDPENVGADLGTHLMRFVMAEGVLGEDEVLDWLEQLEDALAAFVADIEKFVEHADLAGRHPPLALQHGIDIHQASLAWVRRARAALRSDQSAASPGAARVAIRRHRGAGGAGSAPLDPP